MEDFLESAAALLDGASLALDSWTPTHGLAEPVSREEGPWRLQPVEAPSPIMPPRTPNTPTASPVPKMQVKFPATVKSASVATLASRSRSRGPAAAPKPSRPKPATFETTPRPSAAQFPREVAHRTPEFRREARSKAPLVCDASEAAAAKYHSVPWDMRGPAGPKQGGPSTWMGQRWREGSQRFANRGGQRREDFAAYYASLRRQSKGEGKGGTAAGSSEPSMRIGG